jgi:hypothetical protein
VDVATAALNKQLGGAGKNRIENMWNIYAQIITALVHDPVDKPQ